ncbi:MAG: TetR/AcrR family transcriptional regulator [Candidatus Aegiribacteria sp.]|nr:TetR/AcrR family transcriptional regulator [Candidatus Aegiribacteria sp.]
MSGVKKELILNAAEECFAEKGFSGTSMKEIADRAGVAKSLIYHHFNSKQHLWEESANRRVTGSGMYYGIREMVELLKTDGIDGLRKSDEYKVFFRFLKGHPQFVRMIAWLDAERSFPVPMIPPPELRTVILDSLSELQKDGILRSDLDPGVFVIVFIAISKIWFISHDCMSAWLGEESGSAETGEKYIESAMKILLYGMAGGK